MKPISDFWPYVSKGKFEKMVSDYKSCARLKGKVVHKNAILQAKLATLRREFEILDKQKTALNDANKSLHVKNAQLERKNNDLHRIHLMQGRTIQYLERYKSNIPADKLNELHALNNVADLHEQLDIIEKEIQGKKE